ncbi:MAG: cell division protein FtsW [Candidatus Eiseniibacteriota bacterium]|nr:MAG: cell division protein FtsW [Candidatus Eisenbacteria bacterium]
MLETLQGRKDMRLLAVTVLLMAIGLLMVYTSSAGLGAARYEGDLHHYFKNQSVRMLIAFVGMLTAMHVDYRRLRKIAPFLVLAAFAILLAVILPGVGKQVRGATRWGVIPVQPSELGRFAVVLYLSVFLAKRGEIKSFTRGFLPCAMVVMGAASLTLLQPSLGSAGALIMVGLVVLYVAGTQLLHLGSVLGAGALAALVCILKNPYQLERILGFIGQGARYQVKQSLLALGTGGLIGKGLGGSMQKYLFLPDPHTDFVFSIYGEETGFIGTLILISLFTYLILRGLKIARDAPDRFGFLLATGLTASIGVFFALNIGVVTGLLPTTGLPLPFISYGGSALLINAISVGILLNISGHRARRIIPSGKTRWRNSMAHLME